MPLQLAAQLISNQIEEAIKRLEKERKTAVICLYSGIHPKLVDNVAEQIKQKKEQKILKDNLDIILHTNGGDPDAAFNMGRLFQHSAKKVNIIIPRKAKSAGTLLACCADEIIMFETAELGPLDTQITVIDKNGDIVDGFSALAVRSAENKIKEECKNKNYKYAELLSKRMPDSIKTAELERALEIGKKYVEKLLSNRMFKNKISKKDADEVYRTFVEKYSHHGYVIDIAEAKNVLKLNANLPKNNKERDLIQKIHHYHLKMIELMKLDDMVRLSPKRRNLDNA